MKSQVFSFLICSEFLKICLVSNRTHPLFMRGGILMFFRMFSRYHRFTWLPDEFLSCFLWFPMVAVCVHMVLVWFPIVLLRFSMVLLCFPIILLWFPIACLCFLIFFLWLLMFSYVLLWFCYVFLWLCYDFPWFLL